MLSSFANGEITDEELHPYHKAIFSKLMEKPNRNRRDQHSWKGDEIEITCESGKKTVTYRHSTSFEGQTVKLRLDQKRIYENSGNEYKIVGNIFVDESANKVEYAITVTGGVFGDTPQVCEG